MNAMPLKWKNTVKVRTIQIYSSYPMHWLSVQSLVIMGHINIRITQFQYFPGDGWRPPLTHSTMYSFRHTTPLPHPSHPHPPGKHTRRHSLGGYYNFHPCSIGCCKLSEMVITSDPRFTWATAIAWGVHQVWNWSDVVEIPTLHQQCTANVPSFCTRDGNNTGTMCNIA